MPGKKVTAFRAPGFSIRESEGRAFEILHEAGITTDCSVFPAKHAHGGMPSYPEQKPSIISYQGVEMKEFLMEEMQARHSAIYQGLGGSFDVYTGNVQRAPKWWVDHNLEFAYRLIKQPSRIKRQIHLVRFLALVLLGRM